MLEDILLIKDIHYKAAEKIIPKLLPLKQDKIVIAICGESGAGKSELAHVLGRSIRNAGKFVKIFRFFDNFWKISPNVNKGPISDPCF